MLGSLIAAAAVFTKITAPLPLSKTEATQSAAGVYDGSACAPGLFYSLPSGPAGPMQVLSTSDAGLKNINMQQSFAAFAKIGTLTSTNLNLSELFCGDRGFELIQNMGIVGLPPFTHAAWLVGDFGQDVCGETTVIVIATKDEARVAFSMPLVGLSPDYVCQKMPAPDDQACAKRIRCSAEHVAAKRAALEASLRKVTQGIVLTPPKQ